MNMFIGYVYRITHLDGNFYIGSSRNDPRIRWSCHRYRTRMNQLNGKFHQHIREHTVNGEPQGYEMSTIEIMQIPITEEMTTVKCTHQLRRREQHFIDELKPTLNSLSAAWKYETREDKNAYYKNVYRESARKTLIEKIKNHVVKLDEYGCIITDNRAIDYDALDYETAKFITKRLAQLKKVKHGIDYFTRCFFHRRNEEFDKKEYGKLLLNMSIQQIKDEEWLLLTRNL